MGQSKLKKNTNTNKQVYQLMTERFKENGQNDCKNSVSLLHDCIIIIVPRLCRLVIIMIKVVIIMIKVVIIMNKVVIRMIKVLIIMI